jgi:hypothetical protein
MGSLTLFLSKTESSQTPLFMKYLFGVYELSEIIKKNLPFYRGFAGT